MYFAEQDREALELQQMALHTRIETQVAVRNKARDFGAGGGAGERRFDVATSHARVSRARRARSGGSGKTCCGSSRIHAFARRRSSPSGANGTSRFK